MNVYMWCRYCDKIKSECKCARPSIVLCENDHLEAVKQARADALRWVLEQVPDCGIGPDDCCNDCDQSNYYLSIVNEERARLCAIIEKELSK